MITDKKTNAYHGIGGHFDGFDGKSIIIVAEDAESLAAASKYFRRKKPLDISKCKPCVIAMLNPPWKNKRQIHKPMMRAIYQRDADGNWLLVAAFCVGLLPDPPSDWPAEIGDWLETEGFDVKLIECHVEELKAVLPNNPS